MENIEKWRWVTISPHTETHMVSSLGRIKSLGRKIKCRNGYRNSVTKILKQKKTTTGYYSIQLSNRGRTLSVHRLVSLAFLDNIKNLPQVNHINGIKTDNRVENLEWVNQSENQIHAYQTGLQKGFCISGSGNANNKPILAYSDTEEIEFESTQIAAEYLGTQAKMIYRVLAGKRNMHKGYKFKRI